MNKSILLFAVAAGSMTLSSASAQPNTKKLYLSRAGLGNADVQEDIKRLFVSQADLAIKIPNWTWKNKDYSFQITRQFSNAKEERLLKQAEAVYPLRSQILSAARERDGELEPKSSKGEMLWWGSSFDGVRIPYAVTAASVIYYYQLIQNFRRDDFSGSHRIKMSRANLKYASSIVHHKQYKLGKKNFRNIYVAILELKWDQLCGNLCAMGFERKRIVILNSKGVVAVAGDGLESVVVS